MSHDLFDHKLPEHMYYVLFIILYYLMPRIHQGILNFVRLLFQIVSAKEVL